jgi:hypothetical protein
MKAMLEARMVAIRTQGPSLVEDGLGVVRPADPSQGDLIGSVIGKNSSFSGLLGMERLAVRDWMLDSRRRD